MELFSFFWTFENFWKFPQYFQIFLLFLNVFEWVGIKGIYGHLIEFIARLVVVKRGFTCFTSVRDNFFTQDRNEQFIRVSSVLDKMILVNKAVYSSVQLLLLISQIYWIYLFFRMLSQIIKGGPAYLHTTPASSSVEDLDEGALRNCQRCHENPFKPHKHFVTTCHFTCNSQQLWDCIFWFQRPSPLAARCSYYHLAWASCDGGAYIKYVCNFEAFSTPLPLLLLP